MGDTVVIKKRVSTDLKNQQLLPLIALVMPASTYRASPFLVAAKELGVKSLVVSDVDVVPLGDLADKFLKVDFNDSTDATAQLIMKLSQYRDELGGQVGVLAVDDRGVEIANNVAISMGLKFANPGLGIKATRDKALLRELLSKKGCNQPKWRHFLAGEPYVEIVEREIGYPIVVKPIDMQGSRGVIKADTKEQLSEAVLVIETLICDKEPTFIAESYLDGSEIAVEALLVNGEVNVVAIFDKPEPLLGPYFEETLYVTPTMLDQASQAQIVSEVEKAIDALGLKNGALHVEVRLVGSKDSFVPYVIDLAARTIGGQCSSIVEFVGGLTLEKALISMALGMGIQEIVPSDAPRGVAMLPIVKSGELVKVSGVKKAQGIPDITGVSITVSVGEEIKALPYGDRYIGFAFAKAQSQELVTAALRAAVDTVEFDID
ncbi:MAG: ATP-grasp domain-containing protein [Acidimicrobiales bacterium]|nr:ATP-grasp domain-containing protein [Acidimicrobiales bacterium]